MLIIADSGSTKTEFKIIGENAPEKSIITAGINPFYQNLNDIKSILEKDLIPHINMLPINDIYFYGAGCSFPDKKQVIKEACDYFFPKTSISIENDLLAACRALFKKESGIACILGTGSNSCLYDGKNIIQNVSPLGFILGDEGSGAVLGKKLVSDILKNQAPSDIIEKFFFSTKVTQQEIMERVYKKPFPNRYLASFCFFLKENDNSEYCHNLILNEFSEFFNRNINQYNSKDKYIGFIGSVAYFFQKDLIEVAKKYDFQIKSIQQSPMSGLIDYHKEINL